MKPDEARLYIGGRTGFIVDHLMADSLLRSIFQYALIRVRLSRCGRLIRGFINLLAIVFTANFYVLVPYLLYRDRKMLFVLMNLLLITGANLWIFSYGFPGRMAFGNGYGSPGAFFLHFASD